MLTAWTQPEKQLNNRVVNLPRGKFLGGSSGLNATLILRGLRSDYDSWLEAGNIGWGWEDVLPFFKKSETFVSTNGYQADLDFHGTEGIIHTSMPPPLAINDPLVESFIDKGIPYQPDMHVKGEAVDGVGIATRTIHQWSTNQRVADYVNIDPPANLHVAYNTTVLRIILDDQSSGATTAPKYTATTVAAEIKNETGTVEMVTYRARKEIILSAGAYNSPFLLLHSGVGPKDHLKEVGIEVKVDLKGVGRNLGDHMLLNQLYQVKDIATEDIHYWPPGAEAGVREWIEKKTGPMASFCVGVLAFKDLSDRIINKPLWRAAKVANPDADISGHLPGQPHVEYYPIASAIGSELPTKGETIVGLAAMLFGFDQPGTVTLRSSNPHDPPKINHNYLSSELDLALYVEAARFGHEIMVEGSGTHDHIVGPWPVDRIVPSTDEEWKEFVKEGVTTDFHPSSTCKMGPDTDEEAVVDPRLRVRNVAGLRVADISILPTLVHGHTQAVAYMIGEKAADMILEDNRVKAAI
ncbi:GMC oxidoreductase [Hydnum rufescens UP504]|uniref:GMC oxidoreductase n=1 Tax=Hydnum rufescens UP504 TaxID=1448309 RepID=A0A9P6B6L3_9AGAM|nr:GMC oxidoreductase [Hydnum rufescens UP504]